ncbi:MAG: hypothetical protein GEV04_21065 [Actinophytocola sp.]|nr:hypothetical protein [Actinophytocola sp.]
MKRRTTRWPHDDFTATPARGVSPGNGPIRTTTPPKKFLGGSGRRANPVAGWSAVSTTAGGAAAGTSPACRSLKAPEQKGRTSDDLSDCRPRRGRARRVRRLRRSRRTAQRHQRPVRTDCQPPQHQRTRRLAHAGWWPTGHAASVTARFPTTERRKPRCPGSARNAARTPSDARRTTSRRSSRTTVGGRGSPTAMAHSCARWSARTAMSLPNRSAADEGEHSSWRDSCSTWPCAGAAGSWSVCAHCSIPTTATSCSRTCWRHSNATTSASATSPLAPWTCASPVPGIQSSVSPRSMIGGGADMAGHRRRAGRPLLDQQREQRRLARLADRLDTARTHSERVAAACDYLRGGLKHADPAVAERVTTEVVDYLTAAGKRAFASRRKKGAAS